MDIYYDLFCDEITRLRYFHKLCKGRNKFSLVIQTRQRQLHQHLPSFLLLSSLPPSPLIMKLYAILVYRYPVGDGTAKLVSSAFEVSSFGMMQRGQYVGVGVRELGEGWN